ncbi:L,D-transpeptidase family protein [Shewanella sp. KX20019]|uniref:L,D-transpeptidase family protein n=1 Tax=Shewanella sp. KX20019 TaxID=2803864 RepID=UPI001927449C|nr:L,D-transpeptidase family protein [Shewanella sp. KX20019]QQX82191.1 L,D-transpeptidase family protein [Shewanella sp. KX20019]
MQFASVLFCFILAIVSFSAEGNERNISAQRMLSQQLALMFVVEPDPKYELAKQRLSQFLASSDEIASIEHEIVGFWARRHISVRNPDYKSVKDPYVRAMAIEPSLPSYLQLQNRLRHLQWLSLKDPWTPIEIEGLLRPNRDHSAIAEIAMRLWLLGDAAPPLVIPETPNNYNDALVKSVKRFQMRHGLNPDGIIGPETLKWLNVLPSERVSILAINFILRAEFMAQQARSFLVINIPAFEMELFNNGRVELASRVIVGKPYRQTPLLSGSISNVVINPSWRVPKKILYNDLLPQVRKDGNYIEKRAFDVFDRNGNQVVKSAEQWRDLATGPFPFRFVQRPGVNNTLGRYKFYFPNDHSIFLHDTEDQKLFQRSNRALSSGCIRVENVEGLANWIAANLVKDKQTWVDRHVDTQKTQWFALNATLDVHLVYWTAWIDKNNLAQFRNDIYQKQLLTAVSTSTKDQINDL